MSDRFATNADRIASEEHERLLDRTPKSKALFERAVRHLPLGVASSFQAGDPYLDSFADFCAAVAAA